MRTLEVPKEVEKFAESWATSFTTTNPQWHETHEEHDTWDSHGGFDINLYIREGVLFVTVYPLIDNGSGFMTTDTSTFQRVVTKAKA